MDDLVTNIRITNKAVLPKNTNLKTINGISLINDCNDCEDIVISGGGGGLNIDGGRADSIYTSDLIISGGGA